MEYGWNFFISFMLPDALAFDPKLGRIILRHSLQDHERTITKRMIHYSRGEFQDFLERIY